MGRVRLAACSTVCAGSLAGGLAQGCAAASGLHPGRVQDPDASPRAPGPGACAGAENCGHLAEGVSPTVPQAPESAGRPPSQAWRDAFVTAVERLHGDIFWEPASTSEDVVTRFGDEARAVFGPIPYGDCASVTARSITLKVAGNNDELKPNPDRTRHQLNSSSS